MLRVPIATRDETLYSKTADREPQLPMHQIQDPTNLSVVANLKLTGSHGERIEFLVRRETPTHWYEVLSVDGAVVSGSNLAWFPGGHDATIGLVLAADAETRVRRPPTTIAADGQHPRAGDAARVVYADGSTEPLDLARPSESIGHGITGWFLYEMTPARRDASRSGSRRSTRTVPSSERRSRRPARDHNWTSGQRRPVYVTCDVGCDVAALVFTASAPPTSGSWR